MSQTLISRSPDLSRLREEGYEVQVVKNHLVIRGIPYVTESKNIEKGVLVSELTLSAERTVKPKDHVVYFQGKAPCNIDGSVMRAIQHQTITKEIIPGLTVNRSFSNKPASGYSDYHAKMTRYIDVISAPAIAIDSSATAKTFKIHDEEEVEKTVFKYRDSNASRAHIDAINDKLKGLKLAIIGLGGTGSYILDSVAKTPVQEIHLIDGDQFCQHNAFRCPGAASFETLEKGMTKVSYLNDIYSNMHTGIVPHELYLNEQNIDILANMDFVFICIDRGDIKRFIISFLEHCNIPFIDVGMGITVVDDSLIGTVRTTLSHEKNRQYAKDRIPQSSSEADAYTTNIQIAELNMLNATLAVIKWKKQMGFYQDLESESHITYSINVNQLLCEGPNT